MDVYLGISLLCFCASTYQISALDINKIRVYYDMNTEVISHEDSNCAHQMAKVYHDDVTTPYPPNLTGEWTSMRCEVRPGPQFILRKYRFFEGHRFSLFQYYYEDAHCRRPIYTLVARGSYTIFQPSWLLSGATEMDYQLNHVSIMPHADRLAGLLATKVNASCPGYVRSNWKKNHWYDIFNFVEIPDEDYPDEDGYLLVDRDCLSALSFSVHELQLLRLELRKNHHDIEKRLLLGDIHTKAGERRTYRPTGFQEPLAFMHQEHHCPACQTISESDEYHPPSLPHHARQDMVLTGSWFSRECEIRPNGVFVTRHLSFGEDNRTWEGYYHYFLDGRCKRPQFTVHVSGKYAYGGESRRIQDAHEVDFQVLKASVKPTDEHIVNTLNTFTQGDMRCGTEKWVLDEDQDVTSTKGCRALGLELPHIEYELVKIEKEHHTILLYLGQRPTQGNNFLPSSRPTSFQSALVRCSDNTKAVTPTYSFHQVAIVHSLDGAASTKTLNPALLLTTVVCTVWLSLTWQSNDDSMD